MRKRRDSRSVQACARTNYKLYQKVTFYACSNLERVSELGAGSGKRVFIAEGSTSQTNFGDPMSGIIHVSLLGV